LDFKTDAIQATEVDAKISVYEPQMKLYAGALSQIYRRPVSRCGLYFLHFQMAVTIAV
jgi:ATP-dependent exoDNAse (exonuclease V) beta subunit